MKIKSIISTMVVLGTGYLITCIALAGGLTADQMTRAGFDCFPAGPNDWIHCLQNRHFGQPAIPVKVFSVDGSEFLGTEQLLREDVYGEQPCPQDDLDPWDPLAVPGYRACHHFETGHH